VNTIFDHLEVIFFQKLLESDTLELIDLKYFECDLFLMTKFEDIIFISGTLYTLKISDLWETQKKVFRTF